MEISPRRLAASRLRNALIVSQVTICVLLLICAGRMARHTAETRSGTRRMQTRGGLSNVILRVHKAKRVMKDPGWR